MGAAAEQKKARVAITRAEAGREILTLRTLNGDVFEVVDPELSEELEAGLLARAREIFEADQAENADCADD